MEAMKGGQVVNVRISSHSFSFDPTYGYTEDGLRDVELPAGEPPDFEEFWKELYAASRDVAPAPVAEEGEKIRPDTNAVIRPIRYTSLFGRVIGGWLTTPLEGKIERLVVVGHGYGGREEPEQGVMENAACLFLCARGLPARSLCSDLPATPGFHVLHGIGDRRKYIHGGCCADTWAGASALQELTGEYGLPLHYWGGSFGGGIGALALPWDSRFVSAYLMVPSFGNHPFRLRVPCTGSGESVRRRWLKNPGVAETLRYFDAAYGAGHLRIPVIYACALFDPAVPPPGQFSVWKAHAGPRKLITLSAGHFEFDEGEREVAAADLEAQHYLTASESRGGIRPGD